MNQHAAFFSLEEMVLMITLIVLSMAGIYLGALYWRQDKRLYRPVLIALGIVLAVFIAGLSKRQRLQANQAIVIYETVANFEPRANSTVHFKLSPGTKVTVIKQEEGWTKVKRLDGNLGWVPQGVMEEIETDTKNLTS